jgi:threonyl-tRNA synthetase
VRVLTIGDDERLVGHAKALVTELRSKFVRAEGDFGTDKINGKIQRAEEAKVHTMLVIGQKELEHDTVSVRVHGKGNLGVKPSAEVVADIVQAIRERRS